MKRLPVRLWVSWCATCGLPICAGRTKREANALGCDCAVGEADIRIVRVRVEKDAL